MDHNVNWSAVVLRIILYFVQSAWHFSLALSLSSIASGAECHGQFGGPCADGDGERDPYEFGLWRLIEKVAEKSKLLWSYVCEYALWLCVANVGILVSQCMVLSHAFYVNICVGLELGSKIGPVCCKCQGRLFIPVNHCCFLLFPIFYLLLSLFICTYFCLCACCNNQMYLLGILKQEQHTISHISIPVWESTCCPGPSWEMSELHFTC